MPGGFEFNSLTTIDEPFLFGDRDQEALELEDGSNRFFIIVYNSTSTVSAAYATLIALAIAAAIGAILGLLYYLLLSSKTETTGYGTGYGSSYEKYKRSTDEYLDEELNFVEILNLIEEMESLISADDEDENCNALKICQKMEPSTSGSNEDNKLPKLLGKARSILRKIPAIGKDYKVLEGYVEAAEVGKKGGNCNKRFAKSCKQPLLDQV